MTPDGPDIRDLIERGSLGTPEARAIRATVSQEAARRVVSLARYLETLPCPEGHEYCEGHHLPIRRCWFREEAKGRCVLQVYHSSECLLEGNLPDA